MSQPGSVNGSTAAAEGVAETAAGSVAQATQAGDLQVVGSEYLLRFAVPDDAEELLDLGADPAVTRFFSWGPYVAVEEPLAYINSLPAKRASGALLEFVIVERANNSIVGVTGLTEFSKRDRRAVVGSWLGHRYWGRGVNRASKSLVLALGFRELNLHRISAYSHVRNGRSKAALERIGFHAEGTLQGWHHHRGDPQDVTIHCLLRDQYFRTELAEDSIEITGTVPALFRA